MNFSLENKNWTYLLAGLIAVALIWYFAFGANTSYLTGALIDDLECGEVDGWSTVFSREVVNPATSLFTAGTEFSTLSAEIQRDDNDFQVRIFNQNQACDDQTIVNCDILEVVPYSGTEIMICRDIVDDDSTYLLGDSSEISTFAYYLQSKNLDGTVFEDAIYTTQAGSSSDLSLVNISNYNIAVQIR